MVMIEDAATGRGGEEDRRPLVLFAIEPRCYAQAIGGVIARLRPGIDVRVVAPEDLPAEMGRGAPALVFCADDRPDGCEEAVRWARFSPYEEPEVVRVDGVPHNFPGLDLEDFLWLVDLHTAGAGTRGILDPLLRGAPSRRTSRNTPSTMLSE